MAAAAGPAKLGRPRPARGPRELPWQHRAGRPVAIAVGAAIAVAIAVASMWLASSRSQFAPLAVAVFLLLPTWMFFTRRVPLALGILLLYIGLADGSVKLQTGSQFATIGRDVLLYAIALGMLHRRVVRGGQQVHWPALTGWILAWTAIVVVQILNPENASWPHVFASLRPHLEFVPLFFIGALIIDSRRRLRQFLVLLLVVGAANGVVALVQSTLTPEQLSSWGPGYADLISGKNGAPRTAVGPDGKTRVRPPGLGGDMGFAGILGAIAIPGGIALLIAGRQRRAVKAAVVALIVLSALGPMASQSRSAVIAAIVALVAFAALVAATKRAKQVIAVIIALALLSAIAVTIVSKSAGASDTFYRYRTIAPTKVVGTTVESRGGTYGLLSDYARSFPFGAGLGSTGPASGMFGGAKHQLNGESQFHFLLVEIGVPGLLVFLAMQAHLLFGSVRRLRRYPEPEAQILLAAVLAPLFAFVTNWVVGINTSSTPNAPYLWFAMGILSAWLWGQAGRREAEST